MTEAELILKKALAGSDLDSSQWNQIQAAFRNRAFFSSRIAEVKILEAIRYRVSEYSKGETDISKIRMLIRQDLEELKYSPEPGKEGTIHDLFSQARLDTIIKTNVAQARGYIQYLEGSTPGAFNAFPAQEFTRVAHRQRPRADWPQRWAKAGGKLYKGRMVALKDDPVWANLSVFGNPFPPFDWGSGMGVLDVDRKTAIELGLITDSDLRQKVNDLRQKGSAPGASAPDFNSNLQAEVHIRNDSPEADRLRAAFGDQVDFRGNIARWRGELIRDVLNGKIKKASLGEGHDGRRLSISHTLFKDHIHKHFGEEERDRRNIPLTIGDFELLPTIWRHPNHIAKRKGNDWLKLETFDGGLLNLIVHPSKGIVSFYKTKSEGSLSV